MGNGRVGSSEQVYFAVCEPGTVGDYAVGAHDSEVVDEFNGCFSNFFLLASSSPEGFVEVNVDPNLRQRRRLKPLEMPPL
jgi:hypothetical protein